MHTIEVSHMSSTTPVYHSPGTVYVTVILPITLVVCTFAIVSEGYIVPQAPPACSIIKPTGDDITALLQSLLDSKLNLGHTHHCCRHISCRTPIV